MVAGLGALGRGGDGQLASLAEPSPSVSATIVAAAASSEVRDHVIVLDSPAVQNAEITTRELTVRGHLPAGSGPVAIVLESSGNKVMSIQTVQPIALAGPPWSAGRAIFRATFALSNPRPGGRMVVQVIAYDREGLPFDSLRRRIRIGAVAAVDPARVDPVAGASTPAP